MDTNDARTGEETEAYRLFLDAVATRQVTQWMPTDPGRVLDLSSEPKAAQVMRAAGHRVIPAPEELGALPAGSVDAVVAEALAGARSLTAELTFEASARLLRSGGRLLVRVESHLAGLGELALQERWAELADLPGAEVLLVPDEQTVVRRCFWPEELREALSTAGLAVEWVRPRTVLFPEAVNRLLASGTERLPELVSTELALAAEREGQGMGRYLVASAVKG